MDSNFVSQLFELVLSPVGLVGIVLGLIAVALSQRSQLVAWSMLTLCCFSASLAKFQNQFVSEPPALAFPLQQLRDFGRPLTIVFLCLLIVIAFVKAPSWRRQIVAYPVKYLAGVQLIIFLKVLFYGDIAFAVLAALTFSLVLIMVNYGPSRWLSNKASFRHATAAMAMVGAIFIALNAYQATIDIYPITFVHGRFLGTTGNPQHAAVLLASLIPCFMFLFEDYQQKLYKAFALFGLACVCLALFMTGSRTGLLMAIATVTFFYRNRKKSLFQLGIALAVALAVLLPFVSQGSMLLGAEQTDVSARFLSSDNSRIQVWSAMWRAFERYPILGAPLGGDRLGFGESSWLATAASLGLAGLIPLLLFGISCGKMMIQLSAISKRQPESYLQCSVVISGIACLLVGSFFEAYLLGTLSSALLTLLIYLSLGQYIIELHKVQRDSYLRSQIIATQFSLPSTR